MTREARLLADRHYSRQKPGSNQFVPPGRCVVLKIPGEAYWVTVWQEYVLHAWPGAMMCSAFRNEGDHLSSMLIRQALAVTRWKWGDLPAKGMITFVDPSKIRSRNPGFCFLKAGFARVGETKGGLHVLQCLPDGFPEPEPPLLATRRLQF